MQQCMNTKQHCLTIILTLTFCSVFGQKGKPAYFDNPIVIDSSATILIPTRYSADFLSSNKVTFWNDIYANIIFYNPLTDSSKRLFDQNTYIEGFHNRHSYRQDAKKPKYNTAKWIFYTVKNADRNKSGRTDVHDPSVLYVSDLQGGHLKALTSENENAVSFEIFEKQNYALVKIQRDQDNDGNFKAEDRDFYYVKLDLKTLAFGNKIEIR